jgi:ComF family protein
MSTHVVTAFKDERELRLAPVIAAAMATALDEASGCPAADGSPRFDARAIDAVVYVPASPSSYRRRGFDHMRLVATALARELELPLADLLERADARDQRELGRAGRLNNLSGSLQVCQNVAGMDFLLVDDVITTGASLRACARALLARGAHSVTASALVRGW